jgi:branched-chain amino acid transport system ATP-binding protein
MFRLQNFSAYHGASRVVENIDLDVDVGEVVCILGRNGAGKTSMLHAIMNLMPRREGTVILDDVDISRLPAHDVPRAGIGYVPQGRRLFNELTVEQNLEIGLMVNRALSGVLDSVLELFPILKQRLNQVSGTLSGGEQQLLAMARALCIEPKLLLLDEPTEGLMPSMIRLIREVVQTLKSRGVSILLVEQRVGAVLDVADRVAFIETGRLLNTVAVCEVEKDNEIIKRYLGVSR